MATKKKKTKNPSPGVLIHGKHATAEQRKAAKRASEKARAWFDNDSLMTAPKILPGFDMAQVMAGGFVEIGTIHALAYTSDKYTGDQITYEHEFTKKRRLFISSDGSTMVVFPPMTLTKLGITG